MSTTTMVINDKTNISLFAVLCSLPFLVGAILWLASVDAKATAAVKKGKAHDKMLWALVRSNIRIETKMGTLPKDRDQEFPDEDERE